MCARSRSSKRESTGLRQQLNPEQRLARWLTLADELEMLMSGLETQLKVDGYSATLEIARDTHLSVSRQMDKWCDLAVTLLPNSRLSWLTPRTAGPELTTVSPE